MRRLEREDAREVWSCLLGQAAKMVTRAVEMTRMLPIAGPKRQKAKAATELKASYGFASHYDDYHDEEP